MVDDFGIRIQIFQAVENAFHAANCCYQERSEPLRVLILGSGEIGKLAANTAIKFTDRPVVVSIVGRSVTRDPKLLAPLLKETDILVDASKRNETRKSIISNHQLALLPEDALIIDLSADDYDVNVSPIKSKFEGTTGNWTNMVSFKTKLIKAFLRGFNQPRILLSCYLLGDPNRCLDRYETQLDPFIRLLARDLPEPSLDSDNPYERALARGSYAYFLRS